MIGWLKFWDVYCCHVYFFSVRFLNICKPRTTFYLPGWPNWIGILWKWASMLTKPAGYGECRLAQFHAIRFLANEIYHFSRLSHQTGFLFTWAAFLRMQFSLVATYFSVVLVIYLRWFLHLKLSHEFFTFISFNIWRLV